MRRDWRNSAIPPRYDRRVKTALLLCLACVASTAFADGAVGRQVRGRLERFEAPAPARRRRRQELPPLHAARRDPRARLPLTAAPPPPRAVSSGV